MRPNKNLTISFVILVTVCLLLSSCWKEDVTTITRIPQKQAAGMFEGSSAEELVHQILRGPIISLPFAFDYFRNSFEVDTSAFLNKFVCVLKHSGRISPTVSLLDIPRKGDFIFYQPDRQAGVASQGWFGIVIDTKIVNRDEIEIRSIFIGGNFLSHCPSLRTTTFRLFPLGSFLFDEVIYHRILRS